MSEPRLHTEVSSMFSSRNENYKYKNWECKDSKLIKCMSMKGLENQKE